MEPPTDWPPVIRDNYEPIRILGKGGFAAVMLARPKASSSSSSPTNNTNTNQDGTPEQARTSEHVAIKVAGNATMGVTKKEQLYAHREIDILRAISHPNIMKCLDYVEPSPHTAMVLVLSYSPGPTVHSLLKKGGALSTIFGRVVIAQLVDAITYLHSHAVVHRDIKPDNVIVTGAFTSQSDIWDNPEDYDDDLDHDGNVHHHSSKPPDWPALLNKWHVTLIDFGFARALTKDDVHQPSPEYHQENMDASYHQSTLVADGDATSMGNSQSSKKSLNRSISRSLSSSLQPNRGGGKQQQQQQRTTMMLHRQMSAVGCPQFAAPEIKNKVHQVARSEALSKSSTVDDITRTISSFVADYGLLVDAYSLGCTIRYMMTGCVPHQSVAEAIANQNTFVDVLCRMMACGNSNTRRKNKKPERTLRYRLVSDLPGEVQRLIEKLTVADQAQRASVRAARRYNWIDDVLPVTEDYTPSEKFDPADIQYLDFSNTKEEHAKHFPRTCTDQV